MMPKAQYASVVVYKHANPTNAKSLPLDPTTWDKAQWEKALRLNVIEIVSVVHDVPVR